MSIKIQITNSLHLIHKFINQNKLNQTEPKFSLKTKTNKIFSLKTKNEQVSQLYIHITDNISQKLLPVNIVVQ